MADARLIAVYAPSRHLGIVPLNLQTQLILINWDHVSHHIPPHGSGDPNPTMTRARALNSTPISERTGTSTWSPTLGIARPFRRITVRSNTSCC